jgi:hypothetical protein
MEEIFLDKLMVKYYACILFVPNNRNESERITSLKDNIIEICGCRKMNLFLADNG